MGDWFNAAQQQYDHAVPEYLEDEDGPVYCEGREDDEPDDEEDE